VHRAVKTNEIPKMIVFVETLAQETQIYYSTIADKPQLPTNSNFTDKPLISRQKYKEA